MSEKQACKEKSILLLVMVGKKTPLKQKVFLLMMKNEIQMIVLLLTINNLVSPVPQ